MHLDGSYCPFRVGELKATLLMHFNWSSILPGVVTAVLTRWSLRDKRRTAIQVFNIPLCVPLICSLVWSWVPRVPLLGSLARFSKPAPRIRSQYIIVQELPSLSFYRERSVTREELVFFYSQLLDLSFTVDLYSSYNIERYRIRNQCTERVQRHLSQQFIDKNVYTFTLD